MNLRTGLAQINTTVGDFTGNIDKIRQMYVRAKDAGVDLLIFPELSVCGYPPEDLLLKKHFLAENKAAVEQIAKDCPDITIMVGFAEFADHFCYNSLAGLQGGQITKVYRKCQLPNYGVFDEKRYFSAGSEPVIVKVGDMAVACSICEDIWELRWLSEFLAAAPQKNLLVNISASPFHAGKIHQKISVLQDCAKMLNCAIA